LDALDLSRSVVRRLPQGQVVNVEVYAFEPQRIVDEWLFKVATSPFHVLVTDRFRELVAQHGLTGFFFQPVWDSEHEPFRPTPGPAEMLTRPEVYGPHGFVPNLRDHWPPEWKEEARRMKQPRSSNPA
jgi:hypothetical protein